MPAAGYTRRTDPVALRMARLLPVLIACFAAAVPATAVHALTVYDDALRNGFQDYSYGGGSDFANGDPVHEGTASIAFTGNAFNAVSFAHPDGDFAATEYPVLHFWIHGGAVGNQQLRVIVQLDDAMVADAELDGLIDDGAIAAGEWREVEVTFAAPPLGYSGAFDRIDLQSDVAGTQPVLYIDDVELLAPITDVVFADGFDGDGPPPPANGLLVDHDVPIDGMLGDRFTWRDSADRPRVAVLAHNDGASGPGGTRGGELREFRYETGSATRIVRAPPTGAGGFGYVVSHRFEGTSGIAADDSPLGHGFPGSFTRVFEGRHHAILRFTQLYPRYSRTDADPPNTRYDVPVTIEWLFATGRDHPLWAVTWDLSGVPVDALNDDSRAPYGELLFDGAASQAEASPIAGVGWGDRYRFASTGNPVTYNSAWTWNVPNAIPYVKLWTTAVDAIMGSVQTQTIVQQDAGGYYGVDRWGTTSADGDACFAPLGPPSVMPCDYNWPFQSINYSLDPSTPDVPTDNTRLAWGTNFGFLGQATYLIHGSAYYGGPLPDTTAPGWPRKSYSTYVVLGLHSADAVAAAVEQVEAVQTVVLTANVGTVATDGPAGVGREDTMVYDPPGYDPVRGALTFTAAGNALDANIAVGAGALENPLLVIRGYGAGYPTTLRYNNAPLVADRDYFASLRPGAQELWITLDLDLAGAANRIEVIP
jgi:hypothetical protein